MADKITTTEKQDVDPNAAVNDAIETLRQAMLDTGMEAGTVEAKLSAVKPNESSIVGNFADLQRIGVLHVEEVR